MERTDSGQRREGHGGAMTSLRVAVYGGSFDPPHLGHILSIAWALSAADVDQIWVIPTWEHAFDKAHRAPFAARMKMCELALAPFRDVKLLDIEKRLGGASRTLDTLEALESANPDADFRLLIGADVLLETNRWHRWEAVVGIAPPLVVGREGYPLPEGCPITIPNVSSTEVRRTLDRDGDLAGLVPSAVVDYIRQQGLYEKV